MMLPRAQARARQLLIALSISLALAAAVANAATKHQHAAPEQVKKIVEPSIGHSQPKSSSSLQPVAEKKQGDVEIGSGSHEEFVQIKPEELSANDQNKEIDAVIAAAVAGANGGDSSGIGQASGSAATDAAEHKSADDELSAHLAHDTISQLESSHRPQQAVVPASPRSAPSRLYGAPTQSGPRGPYPQSASGRAHARHPLPPRAAAGYQAPRSPRMPPSYMTLKGGLTGINSIINQYPHPAPGYPHHGPRHLPRGAAAGYAAFRDFVRAHASKYKGITPMVSYPAPHEGPRAVPPPPPPANRYPVGGPVAGGSGHAKRYRAEPSKTKVSVAQAYIPHLNPTAETAPSYGQAAGSYSSSSAHMNPATNPMLAKLYGGHAPQGAGRPEYSKDFGMVIHYPQATVYTEPMTVDKLHKLTGSGISSILEHLQYNLAKGHRDEGSMLRANRQHDLGHGVTLHAKEYYAPGKGGHYVPTTAAVISAPSAGGAYENEAPAAQYGGEGAGHGAGESSGAAEYQGGAGGYGEPSKAALGAGYERVKQAVAAGQGERYNNYNVKHLVAGSQAPAPSAGSYEQHQGGNSAKSYGSGESLSAITNLVSSDLDSLYKANAALTKHLEPEIHDQIQAYAKSGAYGNGALKYRELDGRAPMVLQEGPKHNAGGASQHYQQPQGPAGYSQHSGGYGPAAPQRGHRAPRRGNRYQKQGHQQQNGYRQQQQQAYGPQQQHSGHGRRPNQVGGYMQQQQQQQNAYRAAEQALNQQVMQLIHDFQSGDDQYNGKNQPMHQTNQGYPHKVMQKYQQQQQHQQQPAQYQQQPNQYQQEQHAPLEIPQGPNDQIGEISDLIEALKGTLESQNPGQMSAYGAADNSHGAGFGATSGSYGASGSQKLTPTTPAKIEDVNYLTSTLGQVPSYAVQVPVASEEAAKGYGGQAQTEQNSYGQAAAAVAALGPQQGAYQQQQPQPQQQQQASSGYQQQPQQYQAGEQQPQQQQQGASGYQQQTQQYQAGEQQQQQNQGAYQQAQSGYQQQQASGAYGAQSSDAYGQQQQQSLAAAYNAEATLAGGAHVDLGADTFGLPSTAGGQGSSSAYGSSQQQQHIASAPQTSGGSYGQQAAASAAPVSGSYSAQAEQQPQQQQSSSYSSAEQGSVINHLVPVAAAAPATGSYEQQQPINQIAISNPTEAHAQQAQSLSSFVDSLPTDYQELLRQPALISGHGAQAAHLAALGQDTSSAAYQSSTGQASSGSSADSYQSAASSSQPTYSAKSSSSSSSTSSASPSTSSASAASAATSSQSVTSASATQQVAKASKSKA